MGNTNGGKEDVIGWRTFEKSDSDSRGILIALLTWLITSIFMAGMLFWIGLWLFEEIDWFSTGGGIFMLLFGIAPFFWYLPNAAKKSMNNRSRDPTITVTEEGTFFIYHANGKKECLTDKIREVSASGNRVSFVLEDENGRRYHKWVGYVENSSFAASRIKDVLSLRDSNYTMTAYERARLFCQYCGSRVGSDDRVCGHCGGRITK